MQEKSIIIERLQSGADEMIRSLRENELTNEEKIEWFGYIRGVRDCAHDIGVLQETSIQAILMEALEITKQIHL